jgi:hypothetical protein
MCADWCYLLFLPLPFTRTPAPPTNFRFLLQSTTRFVNERGTGYGKDTHVLLKRPPFRPPATLMPTPVTTAAHKTTEAGRQLPPSSSSESLGRQSGQNLGRRRPRGQLRTAPPNKAHTTTRIPLLVLCGDTRQTHTRNVKPLNLYPRS